MKNYRVAIIGGGPTGLVLAIELGMRNIPTIVFDSRTETTDYPKGASNSARSMEHYRRYGIADALRHSGLPETYPTDVAYFTRMTGEELARVKLPSIAEVLACGLPETPEPPHRAAQMFVEPLLVKKIESLPSVTLAWGHHVEELEETHNNVKLIVKNLSHSQHSTVVVDYAVGCDGANSMVSRAMNVEYEGESGKARKFMGGKMLSIYFNSPDLQNQLSDRLSWQYWSINPDTRCVMAAVDGKGLFFFHTQIPVDARPTEEEARQKLYSAIGRKFEFDLKSISFWIAGKGLVAKKLATRRLFLVGDAAHIFTPTGGFGLNTGVDDAANLGWKLAASIQQWGGQKLLHSYHTERHAIAVRNTKAALEIADRVGACPVPKEIEENSPAGVTARKLCSDYLKEVAYREFKTLGVQLGASYFGSDVIVDDGSSKHTDDPIQFIPSFRPGNRLPHIWVKPDRSSLDEVGTGLSLFSFGIEFEKTPWLKAAKSLNVKLEIISIRNTEVEDQFGQALLLVRPDQHIAWRGQNTPVDVQIILSQVLGIENKQGADNTGSTSYAPAH